MDKQTNNNSNKHSMNSRFISKEQYHKPRTDVKKIQEQIDKYEEMLDWMYGTNDVNKSKHIESDTNSKY